MFHLSSAYTSPIPRSNMGNYVIASYLLSESSGRDATYREPIICCIHKWHMKNILNSYFNLNFGCLHPVA
jgi:hypothetical protein